MLDMIKLHFVKQPVLSICNMSAWIAFKKKEINLCGFCALSIMCPHRTTALFVNLDARSSCSPIEGTVGCMVMHSV